MTMGACIQEHLASIGLGAAQGPPEKPLQANIFFVEFGAVAIFHIFPTAFLCVLLRNSSVLWFGC